MASKYKEKILKINQRTKVCYIFIYYDTVIKMIVEIPTVTMKSRKKVTSLFIGKNKNKQKNSKSRSYNE